MLRRYDEAIDGLSGLIASKTERLCDRLGGRIVDEDDFTSRMLQSIEEATDGAMIGGVRWTVETRKLPWRGKASEEKRYGADFGLVVRMDGAGLNVSKGYLVQAKKQDAGFPFAPFPKLVGDVDPRLKEQAKNMLNVTPESYAWFYTPEGVFIVRAGMIVDAPKARVDELHYQGVHGFFRRAFMSWSGDYRLGKMAAQNLDVFMQEFRLKQAILIQGRDVFADGRE